MAISGQDHLMGVYHEALMREIQDFAQKNPIKNPLETIYLGGGTPSTWPNDLLLDMFGTLESTFDMRQVSEITIEVNPGTVQEEQLDIWKAAGITRLSIGVQSLNDEVLKKLNRHQKAEDVFRLIDQAAGRFNSLSVDVIIGLPGVEQDEWKKMIQQIVLWPIQHISMYFLSVHENTPLYTRLIKNELRLPPQDPLVDLYHWTVDCFAKHGLEQYEISSFARPGYEAHHNQVYWERKPYKGFGIGACSFDGNIRYQNIKNVMRYMEALKQGEAVQLFKEELTPQQIRLEKVMLGLRRMKGLKVAEVTETMNQQEQEKFLTNIEVFKKAGIITGRLERIYLSKTSLAVENEVAVRLLQ